VAEQDIGLGHGLEGPQGAVADGDTGGGVGWHAAPGQPGKVGAPGVRVVRPQRRQRAHLRRVHGDPCPAGLA
jgi:hypothetical protein